MIIGADELCEVLSGHAGAACPSITGAAFSGIQLLSAVGDKCGSLRQGLVPGKELLQQVFQQRWGQGKGPGRPSEIVVK